MTKKIKNVFIWESFGPYHGDRIEAVNRDLSRDSFAIGIQIGGASFGYIWCDQNSRNFELKTLYPAAAIHEKSGFETFIRLTWACLKSHGDFFFFCHPEQYPIFLSAALLRLFGKKVILMTDSKLDDKPRYLWKECLKRIFYLPYKAAFVSSVRSQEYMSFWGLPRNILCKDMTRFP